MHELTDAERHLLLCLWDRRDERSRTASLAELQTIEDKHAPGRAFDLTPAVGGLEARGLIQREGDAFTLTDEGIAATHVAFAKVMHDGFSAQLVRDAKSRVFAEYCRRVNGVGHFQYNIVDVPQLDRLIESLSLRPGDRFADLGCATGALTVEIARRTGAHGVGLDFAEPAIMLAREQTADNERVSFVTGNMNTLELPGPDFDAIVAIDTLYFVDDLPAVVGDILARLKPSGRFATFYSSTRRPADAPETLSVDATRLAKALQSHGAEYEATDFTSAAQALWRRASLATEDLKEAFFEEGEQETWESRDRENREVLSNHEAGLVARHLYVARPGS